MNEREQFKHWLARQTQAPGLMACGLGFSGKTWFCLSSRDDYPVPALETAMRALFETFEVAHLHRIPALELEWQFARATVYAVRRPDRVFVALFFAAPAPETARGIIEKFKTFQPAYES